MFKDISKIFFLLPVIVFTTFGALVSVLTYNEFRDQKFLLFKDNTEHLIENIEDRLEIYVNSLNGTKALFQSSELVERIEFESYINNLNIDASYPGVQGIGFIRSLSLDQVEGYIEAKRSEGFANFTIYPEGTRDHYEIVDFIEPFNERNQRTFGYDMYSESTRQIALESARDTGEAQMTSRLTLLQEFENDAQSGFIIFTPFYGTDSSAESISEKQDLIEGYIYGAFRMRDFMSSILQEQDYELAIQIFDGRSTADEEQMFNFQGDFINSDRDFIESSVISLYGNQLTVVTSTLPDNEGYSEVYSTLATIIVLAFLLGVFPSLFIFQRNNTSNKYSTISTNYRKKLNHNLNILEKTFLSLKVPLIIFNKEGNMIHISEDAEKLLVINEIDYLEHNLNELLPYLKEEAIVDIVSEPDLMKALTEKEISITNNQVNKEMKMYIGKFSGPDEDLYFTALMDLSSDLTSKAQVMKLEKENANLNKVLVERESRMIELKNQISKYKNQ